MRRITETHCVQTTGEREEEAVDFYKELLEHKFPRVCATHIPGKTVSSADLLASEAIITLKKCEWRTATVFSILLTHRTKEWSQMIFCAWRRTTEDCCLIRARLSWVGVAKTRVPSPESPQ